MLAAHGSSHTRVRVHWCVRAARAANASESANGSEPAVAVVVGPLVPQEREETTVVRGRASVSSLSTTTVQYLMLPVRLELELA